MVWFAPPAGNARSRLDGLSVPLVPGSVALGAGPLVRSPEMTTGTVHWPAVPPVRVTVMTSAPCPTCAFGDVVEKAKTTGSFGSTIEIDTWPNPPVAAPPSGVILITQL